MNTLINFLWEGSLYLLILFAFYKLFLSELTFFGWNRAFLLVAIVLTCLLPTIKFDLGGSSEFIGKSFTYQLPEFATQATGSNRFEWSSLLIAVYLFGLFWKLTLFTFGMYKTIAGIIKSKRYQISGFNLAVNPKFSPAAFLNFILLPSFDTSDDPDSNLLFKHESRHIQMWHAVDLLLVQVLEIMFWFHPLAYLLKSSVKENHEFQVDKDLTYSHSKKEYANLLLQLIKSDRATHIIHNFNQFQTKKRILMMNRNTSSKWQKGRFLLSLPLVAIMLFVFSCENTTNEDFPETMDIPLSETQSDSDDETARKTVEIFDVVEDSPTYPGGMDAWNLFLAENLKYPAQARRMGIEGTVFVVFVIQKDGSIHDVEILRGIGGGCDEEARRVISQSQRWNSGKQRGQNVNVRMRVPIRFKLN